jgi:hypothetical protein
MVGAAATCVRLFGVCCMRERETSACACERDEAEAEADGRETFSAAGGRTTASAILGSAPVVAGSTLAGASTRCAGRGRATAFEREATCPWTGCPAWGTRERQSRE